MKLFNIFSKKTNFGRVPQQQPGEDGLACIAMLLAHNRIDIGINELRKTHQQLSKGANLKEIKDTLGLYGLTSRAIRCPLDELAKIHTPCIIYWKMNCFAVLYNFDATKVTVLDPTEERYTFTLDEFEQRYNQIVLEIHPSV